MRGSERQTPWAAEIRASLLPVVLDALGAESPSDPVRLAGLPFEISSQMAWRMRDWLHDQDSANWWIDVARGGDIRKIVHSILLHLTRGIELEHLTFISDEDAVSRFVAGEEPA